VVETAAKPAPLPIEKGPRAKSIKKALSKAMGFDSKDSDKRGKKSSKISQSQTKTHPKKPAKK
jgi:hypothetical protein